LGSGLSLGVCRQAADQHNFIEIHTRFTKIKI
jgi:hypothetical protein